MISEEDRKFRVELTRIGIKASKMDAVGAALGASGIGVASAAIALGVNSLFVAFQYLSFAGIGALMVVLALVIFGRNTKDVEVSLKELEKTNEKEEQQ